MALYYYVTKPLARQTHAVVHAAGCPHLPAVERRQFLGTFYHVNGAILQAKKYYAQVNRCRVCCPLSRTERQIARLRAVPRPAPASD